MRIIKVKRNGKLDYIETYKLNTQTNVQVFFVVLVVATMLAIIISLVGGLN